MTTDFDGNINTIKADAIDEMTDHFEKTCDWHFIPTERMRQYAADLRKNDQQDSRED